MKNQFVCIVSLLFVLLIVSCNNDEPIPFNIAPGDYERSVEVGDVTRWYKVVIPPNYDHTSDRPLLFCFHGGNNSMKTFFNKRKDLISRCAEENWILVFPNGSDNKEK